MRLYLGQTGEKVIPENIRGERGTFIAPGFALELQLCVVEVNAPKLAHSGDVSVPEEVIPTPRESSRLEEPLDEMQGGVEGSGDNPIEVG